MTNEEAIIILENERPHCGKSITFTEEEKCDAFDMALEALKAQPCEMRDATEQERKSIDDYVKSISRPTGFNVFNEPCEDAISQKIDEFELKGKTAEIWIVKGKLQIRCLGIIHNIPLPSVTPKQTNGKPLDEIKAEIEKLDGMYVLRDHVFYAEKDSKRVGLWYVRLKEVIGILDKYKEGSEEGESDGRYRVSD